MSQRRQLRQQRSAHLAPFPAASAARCPRLSESCCGQCCTHPRGQFDRLWAHRGELQTGRVWFSALHRSPCAATATCCACALRTRLKRRRCAPQRRCGGVGERLACASTILAQRDVKRHLRGSGSRTPPHVARRRAAWLASILPAARGTRCRGGCIRCRAGHRQERRTTRRRRLTIRRRLRGRAQPLCWAFAAGCWPPRASCSACTHRWTRSAPRRRRWRRTRRAARRHSLLPRPSLTKTRSALTSSCATATRRCAPRTRRRAAPQTPRHNWFGACQRTRQQLRGAPSLGRSRMRCCRLKVEALDTAALAEWLADSFAPPDWHARWAEHRSGRANRRSGTADA